MSGRISNERLAEMADPVWAGLDSHTAAVELQQSRALVTELRALAERMRDYVPSDSATGDKPYILGKEFATVMWLSELSSLLAAHDAQQAEGK